MEATNVWSIVKIAIIGLIEGVTEWLPVSSTGHMLLFDGFFPLGASEAFKETFFVVIQLGAVLAVTVVYRERLRLVGFRGGLKANEENVSLWLKVAVACIPSAAGIFLDGFLEEHFGTPPTVAVALIVYGVAFIVVEKVNGKRSFRVSDTGGITLRDAFIIGLFQVLSFVPGTSRSGATILGALIIGISRPAAAEFTFYLAIPSMFAASMYKLVKFGFAFGAAEVSAMLFGALVAFVTSLAAIGFLTAFVKKHDFKPFGVYRIVLGAAIVIYYLTLRG